MVSPYVVRSVAYVLWTSTMRGENMNPTQENIIVNKGKCPDCHGETRAWKEYDKYGSEIEVSKCGCGRKETVTKAAKPERDFKPLW